MNQIENQKIAFVYFTYGKEFNALMLSIRSVIATVPNGITYEIHVYDDGDNACTRREQKEIVNVANYHQTFHNRGGNLRGPEHLIKATELYAGFDKNDYKIVVKVDSDTVMINQDWIQSAVQENSILAGAFFPNQPMYLWGASYAINTDITHRLALDAKKYPAHGQCFEDYEVGMRIQRFGCVGFGNIDRYQVMRDGFFQGEILEQTVADVDKFMNLRVATLGFAKSDANYPYRMDLMTQLVEKLEAKQKEEKENEEK